LCISADGKLAEEGTYEQLTANPHGAFNKLMEWQLSGSEMDTKDVKSPKPTEEEEIEEELEHETVEQASRNRV
jgi:putative ABC transport system ATP-binding protein